MSAPLPSLPPLPSLLCRWCLSYSLIGLLTACGSWSRPSAIATLNSRYNDQQPALSGDGRLIAFVSDRNGKSEILVYDWQQQSLVDLPGLNRTNAIATSPSLSRTGRYLVYISSETGRPDIVLYDRVTQRSEFLTINYRNWLQNPKISPDGRYIVFETSRRGQWDIEVLDRGDRIELDIPDGSPVLDPNLPKN